MRRKDLQELSNEDILRIYCETGDLRAKNYVIERNLNLVRRIAHGFRDKCREPYDDLFQVGTLGLIKAVNKWKPEKGIKLSTLATPFIRGSIMHWQRDRAKLVKIPCTEYEKYNKIRSLCKKENRNYLEVAETFGFTEESAEKLRFCIQEYFLSVPERSTKKTSEDIQADLIFDIINTLPKKNKDILKLFFYEKKSKKEIAIFYNKTIPQINLLIEDSIVLCKKNILDSSN